MPTYARVGTLIISNSFVTLTHFAMRILTLPVIAKTFSSKIGKTAIECRNQNATLTVWANGDMSDSPALLCNVVVNEVGDSFVATKDSNTLVPAPTATDKSATKPAFLKGEKVVRLKESAEFKSLTGNSQAAQFAQAAGAYGLTLNVVMA